MHASLARMYLLKRHIIPVPVLALSSLITGSATRRGHDLLVAPSAFAMLHNHIVPAARTRWTRFTPSLFKCRRP